MLFTFYRIVVSFQYFVVRHREQDANAAHMQI
jgi:hypothetical protein